MINYQQAEDQYITIGGVTYAYRRFGNSHGIPLFMHIHFRGTMDHWDPAFINPLATRRPIIILDSAGIGRSGGEVPLTIKGWARVVIEFLLALELREVDVLGFSMGGFAAQMIALDAPKGLVRKLILAGTMPSIGDGVVRGIPSPEAFQKLKMAKTQDEQLEAFLLSFFGPSEKSQAAGRASFERIHNSRPNRTDYVAEENTLRQDQASLSFHKKRNAQDGSYDRLHELTLPVLIANGSEDLLIPTANSYVLWQRLKNANAQLHLYPDSGHGFLYQYADEFASLINDFLDGVPRNTERSRL